MQENCRCITNKSTTLNSLGVSEARTQHDQSFFSTISESPVHCSRKLLSLKPGREDKNMISSTDEVKFGEVVDRPLHILQAKFIIFLQLSISYLQENETAQPKVELGCWIFQYCELPLKHSLRFYLNTKLGQKKQWKNLMYKQSNSFLTVSWIASQLLRKKKAQKLGLSRHYLSMESGL